MNDFSRKNLRFFSLFFSQIGPFNALLSEQGNRVVSFLSIHHAPFELKVTKSIAICYMYLLETVTCVAGLG